MAFLLKVSLSTLVILTGLFLVGQPAEAIKPMAPLEITMELGDTPQVGGEVPVSLKIRSLIEAPWVKIQLTLPNGIEMVSGQDTWEGHLMTGSINEERFILKINKPGKHVIRAVATVEYPGGARVSKGASLLIDLSPEAVLGIESKQKEKETGKKNRTIKGRDGQDLKLFSFDQANN